MKDFLTIEFVLIMLQKEVIIYLPLLILMPSPCYGPCISRYHVMCNSILEGFF